VIIISNSPKLNQIAIDWLMVDHATPRKPDQVGVFSRQTDKLIQIWWEDCIEWQIIQIFQIFSLNVLNFTPLRLMFDLSISNPS